jgi:hypothetical protein
MTLGNLDLGISGTYKGRRCFYQFTLDLEQTYDAVSPRTNREISELQSWCKKFDEQLANLFHT